MEERVQRHQTKVGSRRESWSVAGIPPPVNWKLGTGLKPLKGLSETGVEERKF